MKAMRVMAREEASFRSPFFQSRRHFFSQEIVRSTIQRFGMTATCCGQSPHGASAVEATALACSCHRFTHCLTCPVKSSIAAGLER